MPPKTATKLSGIITLLGDFPYRAATASMIGMNITTTGILLRKPLTTKTTTRVIKMVTPSRPPPAAMTMRAHLSRIPALTIP